MLGGVLADKYTYARTFLITAFIQLASTMLLIPLLCLVPKEAKEPSKEEDVYEDVEPLLLNEG